MTNHSPLPSEDTQFTAGRQPTNRIRRKSPYLQAVEWQDRLFNAGGAEGIKPAALAVLARAWKEQEEIKRKIRGISDPKPKDTTKVRGTHCAAERLAELEGNLV